MMPHSKPHLTRKEKQRGRRLFSSYFMGSLIAVPGSFCACAARDECASQISFVYPPTRVGGLILGYIYWLEISCADRD